jgi:WD40 repeat protein
VKVWDAETGKQTITLKGHSDYVYSVSFNPDGKRIVSGSSDKTATVWDGDTRQKTLTLKGHTNNVHRVTFCSDRKRIVSGSSDSTVKL